LKAILDTSVLIANGVPRLGGQLAISAASLAELHFGVLVTTDAVVRAERLGRLSDFSAGSRRFRSTMRWPPATANSLARSRLRAVSLSRDGSYDRGYGARAQSARLYTRGSIRATSATLPASSTSSRSSSFDKA